MKILSAGNPVGSAGRSRSSIQRRASSYSSGRPLAEANRGRWHVPEQIGRGRPTKHFILASDDTDTDKNRVDAPETRIVPVSDDTDDLSGPDGVGDSEWGGI